MLENFLSDLFVEFKLDEERLNLNDLEDILNAKLKAKASMRLTYFNGFPNLTQGGLFRKFNSLIIIKNML